MSSADWSGGSAIDTNGYDYLTFNGGNNGTSIQATAEGTGLADQGVASQGIYALVVRGCTFENLTIANLYVHTSTSDTSVDQTMDNGIVFSGLEHHGRGQHDPRRRLGGVRPLGQRRRE